MTGWPGCTTVRDRNTSPREDRQSGYLDLLDRYQVGWIERRSDNPGRIRYEDDVQVVVTPAGRRRPNRPVE